MIHRLKIKDIWYQRICSGDKTAEARFNDRDFQRGDMIIFLDETGERERMGYYTISHVLYFEGLQEGYVMLSIKPIDKEDPIKSLAIT